MKKLFVAALLALGLAGCSGGDYGNNYQIAFDDSQREALILVGIDASEVQGTFLDINIGAYDASNKIVALGDDDDGFTITLRLADHNEIQYFLRKVPAGLYAFRSVEGEGLTSSAPTGSIFCFMFGTYAFEAKAGHANYVGSIKIKGDVGERLEPEHLGQDQQQKAQASLADFSNVHAPMHVPSMQEVTFRGPALKRSQVQCGGDPD